MLAIHLTTGIVLLLVGISAIAYIIYSLVKVNKILKCMILPLSEALATIIIGITLITHPASFNTTIQSFLNASVLNNANRSLEASMIDTNAFAEIFNENNFGPVENVTLTVGESLGGNAQEINRTVAAFLKSYQAILDKMLTRTQLHKDSNNRTIFYNNKQYTLPVKRTSKAISIESDKATTSMDSMNGLMMLVYSFVYCMFSLLTRTFECSKGAKTKSNVISVQPQIEHDDDGVEKLSTIKRDCAKAGEKNGAKMTWVQLLSLVVCKWVFPILCILLFYFTVPTSTTSKNSTSVDNSSDVNMIDALRSNLNISLPDSAELSQVINNVYSIVALVSNATQAATNDPNQTISQNITYPAVMYNIVDYFNNKIPRFQPRQMNTWSDRDIHSGENRNGNMLAVRVESFLLFVLAYFGSAYYAKIKQLRLQTSDAADGKTEKQLGKRINAFVLLWLPAILEACTRLFLDADYEKKPVADVLASVLLALGNANRVVTNAMNVNDIRVRNQRVNNDDAVILPT